MTSSKRGTNFQGCSPTETIPSNSFNKLPQEGIGSATPNPRIPRFASLKMKAGIEIQNCAYNTGFKFGNTCIQNSRVPRIPEARACRTKSESRSELAVAQSTRAALVHPSRPNIKNVTNTETTGDTFNGINARTVISRKSQGNDKNKSVIAIAARAQVPPRYPANPPTKAAINVESKAAAGARRSEIRVPYKTRANRSRPISSVPSQCTCDGAASASSRYCLAYPAGASQFAARVTPTTNSRTAHATLRQIFMLPGLEAYVRLHRHLSLRARLPASPEL